MNINKLVIHVKGLVKKSKSLFRSDFRYEEKVLTADAL